LDGGGCGDSKGALRKARVPRVPMAKKPPMRAAKMERSMNASFA
jgi:hypothetical protein